MGVYAHIFVCMWCFVPLWEFVHVCVCAGTHTHAAVCMWFKTGRWKGVVITGKRICLLQKYPRNGTNWAKSLRSLDLLHVCAHACVCELVCVVHVCERDKSKERGREMVDRKRSAYNFSSLESTSELCFSLLALPLSRFAAVAGCG